ncbi:MAG: beta strand repeat-containing protein, partial [Chthoniobacterales bacterium]
VQNTNNSPGSSADAFTVQTPRLTNTGTFHWAIRISYGANTNYWFDAPRNGWSDLGLSAPTNSPLTIAVNALNPPTAVNATAASPTSIDLTWTRGVSGSAKDTIIVRRAGSAVTNDPVQGTTYTTSTALGSDTVVYTNNGTNFTDTGLDPGTTYHYKLYAINSGYYSEGVATNVTTTTNYSFSVSSGTTTNSSSITGPGSLTKSGSGELLLTASNSYEGGTFINAGSLRITNDSGLGKVPASPVADNITISNATLALNGTITLNANRGITLTHTNATIDTYGENDSYSGIIASSGNAGLTKIGGGILTLGGSNTYSGTTTVSVGSLAITNANALGASGEGNGTVVASGAALRLSGGIAVTNELLTLGGTGVDNAGGALKNVSGNNSWSGNLTLSSNARIDSDAGTLAISGAIAASNNVLFLGEDGHVVLSGAISGSGGSQDSTTTSLYKSGTGSLTLSSSNSFTGDTRISRGVLVAAAAGSLGNDSDVFITTNGVLTVSANVSVGSLQEWGNNNGGTATISSNATLTISGANKGTDYMNSISGAGGLTMSGSGNTILSLYGTQSYTGTTTVNSGGISTSEGMSTTNVVINGGTFFVDSGGNINSADITLGSGGTLDIDGTTSARSLATNKVLTASATGANATGTIAVDGDSSFSLGSGSLIFSAYGGGTNAPITVSGTGGGLNLNSRGITVNTTTQLAAGSYKLIAKSGSASVTNTPGALTVGGSGVSGTATLGVTSGELILTVAAQPTLNSATLSNSLSTTFGSASGATSFIASGSNLSGNITATAQSGFEVSTSENGTYSSSVEVASGSPVWVRVIANNSIGALDNVTAVVLTGGGAAGSVNVTTSSSGNAVTVANLPAVTFTPPASLVYNRTAKTYGASASGVVLTLNYTGRNSTSYNSATAPMNVGDYTVTATTSNTNYTGSQAQNFSITQKALTISGATATSRAYNGTTTIAVSGGSLVGVETGDTVTLGGTPTGTVTSAAVGTGKSVTVSGYALGGDSAANYSVTQPTGLTADITAKALTLAAPTITKSKVFNGNTIAAVTAGELSGVETGDTVNVSAAARYEDANAGTNKMITVTYVISGASVANYTLHNVATIFDGVITPSTPTITSGPTATAITVGQALSASTLSGSATGVSNAVVGGNFAFATPNFVPSIGTANHGVIFTPTNANYSLISNLTALVTVNAAPLTNVGAKFSVSTNGVYAVVDSNNSPIEGATFAYLYRGRTNVIGLNTSYAFASYSNTNAPINPGFYSVTATASGDYTGTLVENYAIAGPLHRTINVSRSSSSPTNILTRTNLL